MINSLQALRFWAIFLIFVSHYVPSWGTLGAFGVSFFIILSGFVITVHYKDKFYDYDIKRAAHFLVSRVKKFYWLHIIMLLTALPFVIRALVHGQSSLWKAMTKFLFNVTLTQSYVPASGVYFSYNAVSWYLSASLIFYFLAPFIMRALERVKSTVRYVDYNNILF